MIRDLLPAVIGRKNRERAKKEEIHKLKKKIRGYVCRIIHKIMHYSPNSLIRRNHIYLYHRFPQILMIF